MMYLTPWQLYKMSHRTDLQRYDLNGKVIASIAKTSTNDTDYSMVIRTEQSLIRMLYHDMQGAIDACDELLVEKFGCVLLSEEQFRKIEVLI